MSRRLLAFLLSELKTVRIICKNPTCQGAVEIPVEHLGSRMAEPSCRICGHPFQPFAQGTNGFSILARAIQLLQQHADQGDVEFILPESSDE
jgi:hypothetical protein